MLRHQTLHLYITCYSLDVSECRVELTCRTKVVQDSLLLKVQVITKSAQESRRVVPELSHK